MAEITADLSGGYPIRVRVGEFEFVMDLPERLGGTNQAPTPTDFFLASIAACEVFYAARFLERRGIAPSTLRASLEAEKGDACVEKACVTLELPSDFPREQEQALRRMVEGCFVKQSIMRPMEIELVIAE